MVIRLDQVAIGLFESFEQHSAVHRGGDCRHELLDAAQLVASKGGRERTREHHEVAGRPCARHREDQQRPVDGVDLGARHSFNESWKVPFDVAQLIGIQASGREPRS